MHGEDGYVTFHGIRHHYIRWGEPGAEPLVLLHGLYEHARSLELVAARLARKRAVYALDLRGHGETGHAPGSYLVWSFARDLVAFAEELDLEAFDLVGIGTGSRVAIAYGRDHSHRIKHVVLAEMGPEPLGTARAAGNPRTFQTEQEALAHFARLYPDESREFHMRQLMASLEYDEAADRLAFRFDAGLPGTDDAAVQVEIPFLWESLEHIVSPALIIRGQESASLPRAVADEMCSRLPDARLVELPGRGHHVALHLSDAFADTVERFVEANGSGG